MKRFIGILAGLLLPAGLAMAGSPARVTGTVGTNGTSIAVSPSGGNGFQLQGVVVGSVATTTQTVNYVIAGITNLVGTHVTTATDRLFSVTNGPWLMAGDFVRIVPAGCASGSTVVAYTAVLLGETQN